jgi:hypothetical protein
MAGLVHPGITYIALQQNATASRMPPGGTCVHCSKREARHKQKMWEIILYHALAAHKLACHDSRMSSPKALDAWHAWVAGASPA